MQVALQTLMVRDKLTAPEITVFVIRIQMLQKTEYHDIVQSYINA